MRANVVDLYRNETGSFTVPADNAVRPFEQPFNSPPPTFAELVEPVVTTLTGAILPIAASLEKLVRELNDGEPDPNGNRAMRRRKRKPPTQPGWARAFPPADPARGYRGRLQH